MTATKMQRRCLDGEIANRRIGRRFEGMAMNRLEQRLDQVDRKLVAILRSDGRRSTAAIARDLNLSRTAVQARIARLEQDGIILGYSARIATSANENLGAIVVLSISVRPCSLVLDELVRWPEVDRVYSTAGERDAILIVSVTSPAALSRLADKLQAVVGIRSVETTVILAERARSLGQ